MNHCPICRQRILDDETTCDRLDCIQEYEEQERIEIESDPREITSPPPTPDMS